MTTDLIRLIESGELRVGDELYHRRRHRGGKEITARLTPDGIEIKGTVHRSPSTAARKVARSEANGWIFWRVRRTGQTLAAMRATSRRATGAAE